MYHGLYLVSVANATVTQQVKNLPAVQEMQETLVQWLCREDPLEEEMATLSTISDWEAPWTQEPGGL